MARKGCGPYNLGAPKAIGKQIKDPKTGKVETTQSRATRDGIEGTLTTIKTTTPGSRGGSGSGSIIRTPEGDAAYAALTPEQRKAQDAKWRARNPRTPDQVDIKERFTPDSPKLTAQPIKPFSPKISAEGIKPPKKAIDFNAPSGKYFYKKDVNKKFGSSSERGRSSSAVQGPNFGDKDYGNVTESRPMTQREEMLLGTDIARKTGGATASPYGQGGEEGFQNYLSQVESKLKDRTAKLKARSSNKKLSSAFKMSGYPNNAIGKKYKK